MKRGRRHFLTPESTMRYAKSMWVRFEHSKGVFAKNDIKFVRWLAVLEAKQEGNTWDNSYEVASSRLVGTPAAGNSRATKRAYIDVQRIRKTRKFVISEITVSI